MVQSYYIKVCKAYAHTNFNSFRKKNQNPLYNIFRRNVGKNSKYIVDLKSCQNLMKSGYFNFLFLL